MSVPCHRLYSKTLLAAALVVVFEAAFASGTANASCGDYVLIGGRSVRHSSELTHANPAGPCRCTGPTCSNGDQQLPATPPVTGTGLATDWGLIPVSSMPDSADCRFARFESDLRLPRRTAGAIFHPPR